MQSVQTCSETCETISDAEAPETFGSSLTAGTRELGKMRVDFDLLNTLTAVCLIVFKRRLQAGCSLCDPLLVHENMLKNRQLLLRFLRLLSFWVVCLFVFFSCTCPEPPAGGATEPPGPWASWLVPQFPDFWTPETSAPPLQEPAASLWASRRLPRYLTCISACVYLLSHGEHLGLNAVQWLSLSTMTKNLHFCGNFYLIHLRKWFY